MKTAKKPLVPEISDEVLKARMKKIKYVRPMMLGIDGKPYSTDETDKKLFSLFYAESKVNPRTQSFNFDENQKILGEAKGLVKLAICDVYIKVGGYYGFLKMTMAEVLSQIPGNIVEEVVAFSLNPEKDAEVIDGGNHQIASIIFYKQGIETKKDNNLPSFKDLIKPVNLEKAEKLKNHIRPMINYNDGPVFLDPANINEAFMRVGIWLRINGSNLHATNTETKVDSKFRETKKVSIYQAFTDGADFYNPTYATVISQIPDKLINEKTIGLMYGSTDYFRTIEGIIHKTEYTIVEKE